ncbi:sugar phosphate isomerase/epimerase [Pedobacter foliorum]|uniref:sugar phosphate isomerase/epimerase family protein n=1 Tax=Pedobacter foliorum TaxID=2739058 RepID=UPI00156567DA|nr:sugar phosphate isomerase/epimerase [Pedobacter foliorum]NRF40142.1 sugar phosphate isomerase/epimerase [Pedobacter foliorum]
MKTTSKYLLLVLAAFAFMAFTYKDKFVGKPANVKWKTGVALYSFNQHDLNKALTMAAQSGVKYVEGFSFYNLGPDFRNKAMGDLDEQGTALMQKMLKDKGLTMSSMYVGDANNEAEWKRYFEMGRKLGLKFLVCEPRQDLLDMVDSLAGVYKIKVAIHQHVKGSSPYWHPDTVLAATKGHPNIGACADLGHWVRSGLDPVKCLEILAGHVFAVHLKDVDPSGTDVDLGTGSINFSGVIRELKKQKFDGFINVECEQNMSDNLEDVKEALAYFNSAANKIK